MLHGPYLEAQSLLVYSFCQSQTQTQTSFTQSLLSTLHLQVDTITPNKFKPKPKPKHTMFAHACTQAHLDATCTYTSTERQTEREN